MIDCNEHRTALVRFLSGDVAAVERASVLDALRGHAASCASCSGDRALLQWVASRTGPLDADEDPGQPYWDSFEARLEQRLDGLPQSGRGSRLRWMALAATLLFALIGWAWMVNSSHRASPLEPVDRESARAHPIEATPDAEQGRLADATAAQEQFERQLEASALAEIGSEYGALEGLEPDVEVGVQAAGWLPDLSELDDAAQAEMLVWLEERI